MRVPGAGELLDIWERGQRQSLPERMIAFLGAAGVCGDADALSALSIGQRDAHLLTLREGLFGPRLSFVAACAACDGSLESELAVADIRTEGEVEAEYMVEAAGFHATFRLPASHDLVAVVSGGRAAARANLLDRCILELRAPGGAPACTNRLPQEVADAIALRMAAADPQADLELALSCPTCGHAWRAAFDIAGFVWRELHAWAKLTLGDVHELARAYGWREADILALSPTRRQIYLELARQ